MKKILFLSIILIMTLPLFAGTAYEPYAHYIVGHVDSATDFSATLQSGVLFEFDSEVVAYNPDYATKIKGLRIGSYTLLSNTTNFEFFIAHTPFKLDGTAGVNDPGTLDTMDYRLYAVADFRNAHFHSCKSDAQASTPDVASQKIDIRGDNMDLWSSSAVCTVVDQSIYVSLDDDTLGSTADTVAALKSGIYKSTIYFLLKGI